MKHTKNLDPEIWIGYNIALAESVYFHPKEVDKTVVSIFSPDVDSLGKGLSYL